MPVVGWEGLYEVSDEGQVRSVDRVVQHPVSGPRRLRGRVLRANWDGHEGGGYLYVTLSRPGERRNRHVHTLVLEAFVGPRPDGADACHGAAGKSVNTPPNLRWGTRSENVLDSVLRDGTHGEASKTRCKRGHLLVPPNLAAAGIRRGIRKCWACETGHNRSRSSGRGVQIEADAAYADRMKENSPPVPEDGGAQ